MRAGRSFGAVLLAWVLVGSPVSGLPRTEIPDSAEPSSRREKARRLAEEGRIEEAIRELEALEAAGSASPRDRALLGALWLESGGPEAALEILAPLAEETSDPAVLYHAGRAALALGRIEQANRFLTRSVNLEERTPAARELGLLRYRQGRYSEASELLEPWIRGRGEDPEAELAAAWSALRLGRLDRAQELAEGLPETGSPVTLLKGALALWREEPRRALDLLRPLLEENRPEIRREARILMAESYLSLNQSGAAIELLQTAETESEPRLRLKLAQALYQQGRPEEAVSTLEPMARQVLARGGEPSTYPPLAGSLVLEYGRALAASGQSERAVPALETATEILPGEHQAWKALGEALAASGRPEEARKALKRFQRLAARAEEDVRRIRQGGSDPETGNRPLHRAGELLKEGRSEEALEILRRRMDADPEALAPRLLAARALVLLEKTEEALRIAGEAVEIAPENPDALYQRGVAAMAAGRLQEAEGDFRRALEIEPDHVPTLNDLAVLLLSRGERKEGRALLERVLEIAPGDPTATANLERLESKREGNP
ncbi:MAG: tetratricopeptide repeat protein [Thermoanaerobaculia bacterium]|nr:tetratricopeptide repeat protein [Thermoanaerobaculia bacterium]